MELIGAIYDCVGDMTLWPEVLDRVLAYVGADAAIHATFDMDGAIIHQRDMAHGLFARGVEDGAAASYAALAPISPLVDPLRQTSVGEVVYDRLLLPRALFERSDFFDRWIRPAGVVEGLISPLAPRGGETVILTLMRSGPHAPRFDEDGGLDAARPILVHLARALKLNRRLVMAEVRSDGAGIEMLDSISTAVICFDLEGRAAWRNNAARVLLDAQDGVLTLPGGALVGSTRAGTEALDALRARTAAGLGGALALDRPSGRPALCLISVPLRGARLQGWASTLGRASPAGLLAVIEPDRSSTARRDPVLKERLRALYGLTETEALVAVRVARDGGVPATADALGLAATTVRTHLNKTFAKLSIRNQADLAVRLEALGLFG